MHTGRAVVAGCAAGVLLAGCTGAAPSASDGSGASADGPVYSSVAELAAHAELVVLGAVTAVRGSEVDDGGNPDVPGLDITFFGVTVAEVLAPTALTPPPAPGDVLAVGVSELNPQLDVGSEVVLFLEQLTTADAPGIDTEDVFYVIIGMEGNGSFDVQDGSVIARSLTVRGFVDPPVTEDPATAGPGAGEAQPDVPFTTSLADLRAALSG